MKAHEILEEASRILEERGSPPSVGQEATALA
jgi:hypothetical protein